MRISEQVIPSGTPGDLGPPCADPQVDWAAQTRQVVTRDLLARATRVPHGEAEALRFRALHLNLPLVTEVADRLGLTEAERARVEHAALEGLHQAVRLFDPYETEDFVAFASPYLEWQMRIARRPDARRPTRSRRTAVLDTISRRRARPAPR